MAKQQLSLESLHQFDGGAFGRAFDRRLAAAVSDCLDRPAIDKPRKITIEVMVFPDEEEGGSGVLVEAKVKAAVPETKSRTHHCNAFHDGKAHFNGESPANANQMQMPFAAERGDA